MRKVLQPVNALIFDLGAVLYPITTEEEWLERWLKPVIGENVNPADFLSWFEAFETGALTAGAFLEKVERAAGKAIGMEAFAHALNGRLLEMEAPVADMIRTLAREYPLFLLSNTNEIHMRTVRERVVGRFGEDVFDKYFRTCFLSYDLGLRKPDGRIYRAVHERLGGTAPEACLFLDDSPVNVAAAQEFGWQALVAEGSVPDLLRGLGLLPAPPRL